MAGTLQYGSRGIEVQKLQELLNDHLHLGLKQDGIFGPRTLAAVRELQASAGIGVDGVVGRCTWEILRENSNTSKESIPPMPPAVRGAPWLQIARREIGETEISGPSHNLRILQYHSTTSYNAKTDEDAWCSSFINWCLAEVGLIGTKSARARDWLHWGKPVVPMAGAISVTLNVTSGQHHAAFFLSENEKSYLLLGGNQSGRVQISKVSKSSISLLGLRWPINC